MHSLVDRGEISICELALPDGQRIPVRVLQVRFGRATPDRLREGTLAPSYTAKPLVSVAGDAMFGELAVVRWLERDGWRAVWVDTAHGRNFWVEMPQRGAPVALPPEARQRYDAIVAANDGRASGFFDVMAWRDGQFVFVEYLGPGERLPRSAARWVAAAIAAGVSPHDLWIVRCGEPGDDDPTV